MNHKVIHKVDFQMLPKPYQITETRLFLEKQIWVVFSLGCEIILIGSYFYNIFTYCKH